MTRKRKTYSSSAGSAVSHPIRQALYELIRDGTETTPEFAEILNENRLNLYHHLKVLEDAGLIESFFGSDRVKRFRLASKDKTVIVQIPLGEREMSPNIISEKQTIIINPPTDPKKHKQFQQKVEELLAIGETSLNPQMDISQVQVILQPKVVTQEIQKQQRAFSKKRS